MDDRIDDRYWRHRALLYWIYLVAESHTGTGLPAGARRLRMKQWAKVPAEIRRGVADPDVQQRILDALQRGDGWFCRLEEVGWRAGERGGAKNVLLVQETLQWINAFRDRGTIQGNRLLWCSVESAVV